MRHGVQIIFHAAAYKHVHLVEGNARAALANNVLGTRVLAAAADACGVDRLILVSSDKAVFPANVMGASKRLSELIVQDVAARSGGTVLAVARFGNVLGSSGSVLPIFRAQLRRGGPVTVTDPDATRFFMPMQDAVTRLLAVGQIARGGEVFVFDMGPPVRIGDLARRVIAEAGLRPRDALCPDGDIEIRVIGLRPGEKRHESLSMSGRLQPTACAGIFIADDPRLCEFDIASMLRMVRRIATDDAGEEDVLCALRPWIGCATGDTDGDPRAVTRSEARSEG
jgi:FlaA1/EpsC-like NDP-sugar epimerase